MICISSEVVRLFRLNIELWNHRPENININHRACVKSELNYYIVVASSYSPHRDIRSKCCVYKTEQHTHTVVMPVNSKFSSRRCPHSLFFTDSYPWSNVGTWGVNTRRLLKKCSGINWVGRKSVNLTIAHIMRRKRSRN